MPAVRALSVVEVAVRPVSSVHDGDGTDVAFPAPTAAEVCGQKLRRERGKQAAARARHNGAGKSRNFSKQYSAHGKTKHREKIRASEY